MSLFVADGPKGAVDYDTLDRTHAALYYLEETGSWPEYVARIEDGEEIEGWDLSGGCAACQGPIFDNQDWRSTADEVRLHYPICPEEDDR